MQQKICPKCKAETAVAAATCPTCGHTFRTQFTQLSMPAPPPYSGQVASSPDAIRVAPGTHPTGLVILLALLCVPGLASLVNRQYAKAVVLFMATAAATVLTFFLFGIGGAAVAMLGAADAICIGNRLNRGETVEQWQVF